MGKIASFVYFPFDKMFNSNVKIKVKERLVYALLPKTYSKFIEATGWI